MTTNSRLLTEFLSELNTYFTRLEMEGALTKVLGPIKTILSDNDELFAFSLCRSFGGSSDTAFLSEWLLQIWHLNHNLNKLSEANKNFWKNQVPVTLKGLPNLYTIINQEIQTNLLPYQLIMLNGQTQKLLSFTGNNKRYLQRYLEHGFFENLTLSQLNLNFLLTEPLPAKTQFLKFASQQWQYLLVSLPVLLGLREYFFENQSDRMNSISWVLVEEIFSNISLLKYLAENTGYLEFLHLQNLTDQAKFKWWRQDLKVRQNALKSNGVLLEKNRDLIRTVANKTEELVGSLEVVPKQQQLLLGLLDWSVG